MESGKRIILKWVPVHCGMRGNGEEDVLDKEGADMNQQDNPLLFNTANRIVEGLYKAMFEKVL